MPDLIDTIETNASGPKKIKGDELEVEQHSIKDQIELDKYKSAKTALSGGASGWGKLRPSRIVPPGSTGPTTN